jgi:hypothetical protein
MNGQTLDIGTLRVSSQIGMSAAENSHAARSGCEE